MNIPKYATIGEIPTSYVAPIIQVGDEVYSWSGSQYAPPGVSAAPGSPSSPFTTTDQRTAWATANLSTLLPGRTTVWQTVADVAVEYVWNGPLATDWEGIRGPYPGSPANPFASAADLLAAYPSGGPYPAFTPSVANPLSPCGSTLAHWKNGKWVPVPGQIIAQWKGVDGLPFFGRVAEGLTIGSWNNVWAPDDPLDDWLICNPGERIGSLIDGAVETFASAATTEHRYSIRTAPQVGGDIFGAILSGSGGAAGARRGFGQAEIASTIDPSGVIVGASGNAPYSSGSFNAGRETVGTWAIGQTKPYISLKPGAVTDSIKLYSVQIWVRG